MSHREVLIAAALEAPLDALVESYDIRDWGELIQQAQVHRVAALLADRTEELTSVPPLTAHLLFALDAAARVDDNLRRTEYGAVLHALDASGVRAVAVKGFPLSQLVYDHPQHRPYADLDILVAEVDLDATAGVLAGAGFVQAEFEPRTWSLESFSESRVAGYRDELQHLAEFSKLAPVNRRYLSVDVHFRFVTVFDHHELDAGTILRDAEREPGLGWWRPRPADMVCHLGYHAWWDTQSISNILALTDLRLSHFNDIHRVVRRWGLDCADILARAGDLGAVATTTWALVTTESLFGPLPGSGRLDRAAAADLDTGAADRWLQRSTREPLFRWSRPAGERMFDPSRGDVALRHAWSDHFEARLRRGDLLTWVSRDDI